MTLVTTLVCVNSATHQRHALWIAELYVSDALEAACLVAGDEPDVTHLADCTKELLEVAGTDALR